MIGPRETPAGHRGTWFHLLPTKDRPVWQRAALGMACGLGAVLLRLPLESYLDGRLPFVFFLPAVTVAAAKGGIAASVASVVLTAAYLIVRSPYLEHFEFAGGIPLALFVLSSVLVTAVAQEMRLALARLGEREAALEAEVARRRELQERQETLVHELNHRVKNTLATVQALARQASRGGEAPGERLEARILALSKTHDLLTRDDWQGASLREVLEGEISPYRDRADRFVVAGSEVELPARHVLALGVTLHELATNAAKHGALTVADGTVHISWRIATGESGVRRLGLDWIEAGGPPAVAPPRPGFASRLIRNSVERELAGHIALEYTPEGLRCRLDVPLAPQTAMLTPHRAPPAA